MDFETLIAPIAGENPVGADPREGADQSAHYFEIKDARAAARDIERQVGAVDPAEAQIESAGAWRKVIDLSPKLLTKTAKDLEVACWYAEGLARSEGFGGLAKGFKLIDSLVRTYWDQGLYPQADEDGDETRVAPLAALNGLDGQGTLIRPIKLIPIVSGGDAGPLAFWQYEQAVANSKITDPDALQQKVAEGAVTLDMFKRAFVQAPSQAVKAVFQDISEAIASFRSACAYLTQKTKDNAPPSSNVVGALEDIQRAIRSLAPHVVEPAPAAQAAPEEGESAPAAGGAPARANGMAGVISGREDALQKILEIADYFERTEPTSMAPMALREVVRRARLPLHELLQELLQDDPAAREKVFSRAGIRSAPDG